MGSSATDTGNTGYSTASTPRLCGSLVTGFFADSVWLSLIFGDTLCNVSSKSCLWALDQTYTHCELAGRHLVVSEPSKLLVEAESRKPLETVTPH